MRNLKKILALVLALVMSLSLMATASAGTFEDVPNDSPYKTATDVLNGLKVFKGYQDGSFQPEKTITRAEVATIIYRIATADVDDNQNEIYTSWKKFSDVKDGDWYAGYVNFCANAEYVKGNPDGTFAPRSNVTGYAVLAMILRAMGWDRNHEFEGADWQIQTAAIARQEGLLDGVTNASDAQLGQPAPRGMVAQILFNALLTEMVDYTVLGGYQHNGKTLGGTQFGLESVTGVVMANQWANLKETKDGGNKVLAVGKTAMKVTNVVTKAADIAVGDDITLEIESDLDAVGLSYTAYVSGKGSVKTPLTDLVDAGNTVAFNEGKGVNTNLSDQGYASIAKLAEKEGLSVNADSEYFVDYDQAWDRTAEHDILIRYTVQAGGLKDGKYVSNNLPDTWIDYLEDLASKTNPTVIRNGSAAQPVEYTRTIRPDAIVTAMDLEIMQEIFYSADRYAENPENQVWRYVDGEVYVGTSSLKDVSDEISWPAFCDTYLKLDRMAYRYDYANNGESLRIVDNNGDGKADYVLKVLYTLDQVVGTYKDAPLMNNKALYDYSAEKNTLVAPELNQGDVVLYSLIDGQLHVRIAESDTDTVKTHSFKDRTITTASDATYGQSGITNDTTMDETIAQMNDAVEYVMYLDLFNNVRAYKLAQGTKYALVTEMYHDGNWNETYVNNNHLVAEVKVTDAAITEYVVSNPVNNVFNSSYAWSSNATDRYAVTNLNYLQPAIAHLGITNANFPTYYQGATIPSSLSLVSTDYYSLAPWYRNVWTLKAVAGDYGVFDYGQEPGTTATQAEHTSSFTNVAAYTQTGEKTVDLNTASELMIDNKTNEQVYYMGQPTLGQVTPKTTRSEWLKANPTLKAEDFQDRLLGTNTFGNNGSYVRFYPVYKTDYVQLNLKGAKDTAVVKANTIHYPVTDTYSAKYNTFDGNNTPYVNATIDTEFYIVLPGYGRDTVQYFKGIANLPTILDSEIRAAYAVASNTAKNSSDSDYWVADVIVIETSDLFHNWDSVSLMYYSPYETSASVFSVDSLNSQWRTYQPESTLRAKIEITPSKTGVTGAWVDWSHNAWLPDAYGFYSLHQTEAVAEGKVNAGDARRITKDFNDYGIYAGYVTAVNGLQTTGYINVDLEKTGSGNTYAIWVGYTGKDVPIYRITTSYDNRVNYANEINLNVIDAYSDVKVGDPIIWVYEKNTGKLAFVVDMAPSATNAWTVPTWLYDTADFSPTATTYENAIDNPSSEFGKICKDEQTGPAAQDVYTIKFVPATYTVGGSPVSSLADIARADLPVGITGSTASGAVVYRYVTGDNVKIIDMDDFDATDAMKAKGIDDPSTAGSTGSYAASNSFTTTTAGVTIEDDDDNLRLTGLRKSDGTAVGDITVYVMYDFGPKTIKTGTYGTGIDGTKKIDINYVAYATGTPDSLTPTALTAVAASNASAATDAATAQKVSLKVWLANDLPTDGTKKVVVTVAKDGDPSTKYLESAPIINGARDFVTCEFTMPDADVVITADVVDAIPTFTVTPHLDASTGNPTITYSGSTTPTGSGSVTDDATSITGKKGNVVTFTSSDPFFVGVGDATATPSTVTGALALAEEQADGTWKYTYTIDAAADLSFYKAMTVAVQNRTDGFLPLTWATPEGPGGLLKDAADNNYTIYVLYNCAWITFTDPSHTIELDVDDVDSSSPVNGAGNSVKWTGPIAADVTLMVSTNSVPPTP